MQAVFYRDDEGNEPVGQFVDRMNHDLTQQQLAERVGTSHSQIARIESGRHATSIMTLRRIAEALDLRLVVGFESTDARGRTKRNVVTV